MTFTATSSRVLLQDGPYAPRPLDRIEITAGHTKVYAVRLDGVIRHEANTATNAIRVSALLRDLLTLGFELPSTTCLRSV